MKKELNMQIYQICKEKNIDKNELVNSFFKSETFKKLHPRKYKEFNSNKVLKGYEMFTYEEYVDCGWKEVHESVNK